MDELSSLYINLLKNIGEDPSREGLISTPKRSAKALKFLTNGYKQNINDVLNNAIFVTESDPEMIIVNDIEVYSLCEHHLLPFFGKCHVGYIPNGKLIGLSKIPRIVDVFSRRLQVQERLTNSIANTIDDVLNPLGVAVVIEAQHLCMMMRGVQKQNSKMITSRMIGDFKLNHQTRDEFLQLIKRK
jgi:GTP cyclohydrolase I